MASRKPEPAQPTAVEAEPTTPSDKKGQPTPKRKAQEAANQRGLVMDVKSDAKERRARDRARRETEYSAMRVGDEKHMPAEHRGPEKRFIRDYIDARTSIGEFLLPFSLLFVILSVLFTGGNFGAILILGFYIIVIMAAVETFLMIRRLKKAVIAKFGANKIPRGFTFYAIARSLNLRRFRTPRPKVRRGEFPA
jgi:hypothetical protein